MKSISLPRELSFLALIFCTNVFAAPAGQLDPTYGVGGKRTIAGATDVYTGEMALNSIGQAYVAMRGLIARVNHDGSPDTTYGDAGVLSINFPDDWQDFHFSEISAIALQEDGKLIIVANSSPGFAICRLNIDGNRDASFGSPTTPGCTTAGSEKADPKAVVMQPDGRIVVAGEEINFRGFVTRLEPNGQPDPSFAQQGTFLMPANMTTYFQDVGLTADGAIVVGGTYYSGDGYFLAARLRGEDGALDGTFGFGGLVIFEDAWVYSTVAVDVLPDDSVLMAGTASTSLEGGFRPAAMKMTSTGQPDGSFAPGGQRVYNPCSDYAVGCNIAVEDMSVLPDGRAVIAGSIGPGGYSGGGEFWDFFAMRILANGNPDSLFGTDPAHGTSVVPFNLSNDPEVAGDAATGVAFEGNRVVLSGYATIPGDGYQRDFALARLDHGLNTKFTVTPVPGPGGIVTPDTPQQIKHSDRAEFSIAADPGFVVDAIGGCSAGIDHGVLVTAPIVANCQATITFKPVPVFSDGFE